MWNSDHAASKIDSASAPRLEAHDSDPLASNWGPTRRVAFRFACAYLFFYSSPFPLGRIPGTGWLSQACHKLWLALVPWTGKHVLHVTRDIAMQSNGSGDKTSNYVEVFC